MAGQRIRADGRPSDRLRKVRITRNYLKHAEGSVLIELGDTRVVCAVSVGRMGCEFILDMNYEEDVSAEVDVNFVVMGRWNFVEIQGTAEESSFTKQEMDEMTTLALKGVRELARIQRRALRWSP